MARINFETEVWQDSRFQRLLIETGDRHRAIGMVIDLWALAQRHWCPDRQLIPAADWESHHMPEALITSGLAERREEGIYAKGSEEHFAWWFERQEAGRKGGLASAEARRSKAKQSLSSGQSDSSKTKQIEPSSSFSKEERPCRRERTTSPTETTQLWEHYREQLGRQGVEAEPKSGKTNRICQGLVKAHGLEKSKALVDAYLADSSEFIAGKSWPIALLASQQQTYLGRLAHEVASRTVTGTLADLEAQERKECAS